MGGVKRGQEIAMVGFFQTLTTAAESSDKLKVLGLKDGMYTLKTRPQRLYIKRFVDLQSMFCLWNLILMA